MPHVLRCSTMRSPTLSACRKPSAPTTSFPRSSFRSVVISANCSASSRTTESRFSRAPHARQRIADTRAYETAQSRLITSTVEGIQIVNVYIPNGQAVGSEKYQMKLAWMSRLREFFDANYDPATPVLLCGDFNVAPEERDVHDVRLWQGRIMFSEQERATLQHIKDWGFTDAFRLHTEAGGKFTWWDYRGSVSAQPRTAYRSRLDHRTARLEKRANVDRHGSAYMGKTIRPRARAC